MRDPHVEKLVYDLKQSEAVNYKDPMPVEKELDDFRIKLMDGILKIEMKSHYSSVDEARQIVKPFLQAWETDVYLKNRNEGFYFEFKDSVVIDRDPPGPGEPVELNISGITHIHSIGTAKLTVEKKNYPQPPIYKALSPDVETLADRYRKYQDGREPLLSMSYFCLTLIEARSSKSGSKRRKELAKIFYLDKDILEKIGELSSTRGGSSNARKYKVLKELSSKERAWLETVIPYIIIQLATVDAGEKPDKLTMGDLPGL